MSTTPLLQATGLRLVVGGRTLFDGLGFVLPEGGRLAVRGPSGAGKSVLLRVLADLQPADAGEVRWRGRTTEEVGPSAWRAGVGLVAQQPPVFPGSPRDTWSLLTGLSVHRGRVGGAPEELGDAVLLGRELWGRPWPQLSGGERQRLHLCMALALGPEVLLLDEPTSALDPAATEAVEALLRECGAGLVLVSHEVAQAERLGVDGVVELGGTP